MSDEYRQRVLELVERELLGPYSEDEVIDDNPQRRYVVGQLATSEDGGLLGLDDEFEYDATMLAMADETDVLSRASSDADIADPEGDGDEPAEDSASIAKARRESLSSIGMSFVVAPGTEITYEATWGEYRRSGERFAREPKKAMGQILFDKACHLSAQSHDRATIKWIARDLRGKLIVSVFFLNSTIAARKDGTERLYQVQLAIKCPESSPGFLSRTDVSADVSPIELDANDLLFRKRKEYSIGLHTAVRPTISPDGCCRELVSTALPHSDSRKTLSRNFDETAQALSMEWLARNHDADLLCAALRKLFDGYVEWPRQLQGEAQVLEPALRDLGAVQVSGVEERVSRLMRGIETLGIHPEAFVAFRFANEVMARVQFRTSPQTRKDYKAGDPMEDAARAGSWYPFQLAFLLSVLADFVFPLRPERRTVDVLFFPTGGGKTEAYLGLAVFAMAYRRLRKQSEGGAGIGALMRYTLRLLTAQQFSRAATAICAAETARRSGAFGDALGYEPFSIGLWVGPMTPISYEAAVAAIKKARDEHFSCPRSCEHSRQLASQGLLKLGRRDDEANILPITECPWCFVPLCISVLELDEDASRVVIRCPNAACTFSQRGPIAEGIPTIDGLPLFVVDSDVYKMCPTMVIATVDKFATLPFRGEAKALFGKVSARCAICGFLTDAMDHKKKHGPATQSTGALQPMDLIIQDELHTITDNLGSIYGLYETALEFLLDHENVAPKYVCATATTKSVEMQVRHLYGERVTSVFPPSGLEAGDTFFSFDQESTSENPGRKYVGVYAPTFSRLSTFVAVLSAVLAAAWRLAEVSGIDTADPYLTLLGYFNTIRDLGGVKGLLDDDVPPVLKEIAERNSWSPRVLSNWQEELTGRIASSEVPERLRTLQSKFVAGRGCDYMAATNMISVGVDVSRLGAMVVDGQPKTTAEYIQATSRVGRKYPGIVFVVYNAMRPRDVSHYEHFYAYHDSFYRFVEAASVTPFSDGAIDRYLKSAFVACYRLASKNSGNDSAGDYVNGSPGLNNAVVATFASRAAQFGEHGIRSTKVILDELQADWSTAGSNLKYVVYRSRYGNRPAQAVTQQRSVLRPSDEERDPAIDALFAAPRSMRNVEAEVPLRVFVDG